VIASACVPGPSATPAPAFVRPKILTSPSGGQAKQRAPPFPFTTCHELLTHCKSEGKKIYEIVLANEMTWRSKEEIIDGIMNIWQVMKDVQFSGDNQQWTWRARGRTYSGLAYPALRGANQLLNAAGVIAVMEAMRAQLPVTAQAIRAGLSMVAWPGRFQILPGQPAIVLDVAHNPHAAAALAHNLDAMGFYPRTHAVVGAMADKDLAGLLRRMMPLVDCWYFCDLPSPRAASAHDLKTVWQSMKPAASSTAITCSGPSEATCLALLAADPADRILIFGSFFTVGGVLQHGIEGRLPAASLT
jgi:dihydrofolate synthase/folylpolyglutamate synthase